MCPRGLGTPDGDYFGSQKEPEGIEAPLPNSQVANMDTHMKEFIAGMPKAELHIHLEGALEPSLVRKLAERNHLPVPPSSQQRTSGYDFHDLTSFLAVYYPNMTVLQTEEDFFDLAWSYLSKAHSQNVLHSEMFFDPQAHTSRGVPFINVIRGYRQAIVEADRETGYLCVVDYVLPS